MPEPAAAWSNSGPAQTIMQCIEVLAAIFGDGDHVLDPHASESTVEARFNGQYITDDERGALEIEQRWFGIESDALPGPWTMPTTRPPVRRRGPTR